MCIRDSCNTLQLLNQVQCPKTSAIDQSNTCRTLLYEASLNHNEARSSECLALGINANAQTRTGRDRKQCESDRRAHSLLPPAQAHRLVPGSISSGLLPTENMRQPGLARILALIHAIDLSC